MRFEALRQVRCARLASQLLRRAPVLELRGRIGALPQEELRQLGISLLGSLEERRVPPVLARIGVGPGVEEQRDHLSLLGGGSAVNRPGVQRELLVPGRSLEVGAMFDEELGCVAPAEEGCVMKGGEPVRRPGRDERRILSENHLQPAHIADSRSLVHVQAMVNAPNRPSYVLLAVVKRLEESREPVFVPLRSELRPPIQELEGASLVALLDCFEKLVRHRNVR
jgi:hypothetical protein